MIAALILPTNAGESTLADLAASAASRGMIPAHPRRGPFRIALFHPEKIPAAWRRIDLGAKEAA